MPDIVVPDALIRLTERLVEASGTVIRRYFRSAVAVDRKGDASPVTVADQLAEAAIRAILEAERPNDGIIGEELGGRGEQAEFVWVIDPIDGTKAFVTGKPMFGTLVALLRRGVPILGVIDQPITGDRWLGIAGRPTLFNGKPAAVRTCPSLAVATLSTTGPDLFSGEESEAFARPRKQVRVTSYGGDCYAYGLLAAGFIDLVVEAGLKLYDFAALVPIIAGAGGVMTDWQGRPLGTASSGQVIAAGDRRTHREAMAALAGG